VNLLLLRWSSSLGNRRSAHAGVFVLDQHQCRSGRSLWLLLLRGALTKTTEHSPVGFLHFAHQVQVARKHASHKRLRVCLPEHPRHRQAVQQRGKRCLVASAIIDARRVACGTARRLTLQLCSNMRLAVHVPS
jgi:hypothetical protein